MAIAEILKVTASVTIRARIERVFDAWLDPAIAVEFFAPEESDTATFETDPVVGGAFWLVMREANGDHEHAGTYVAIERPHRLVFTWVSKGTDERLSLVTVTFTQTGAGVRVDLLHEGMPDDRRAHAHLQGWSEILAKLEDLFAEEA